jgi:hypothetical protein
VGHRLGEGRVGADRGGIRHQREERREAGELPGRPAPGTINSPTAVCLPAHRPSADDDQHEDEREDLEPEAAVGQAGHRGHDDADGGHSDQGESDPHRATRPSTRQLDRHHSGDGEGQTEVQQRREWAWSEAEERQERHMAAEQLVLVDAPGEE